MNRNDLMDARETARANHTRAARTLDRVKPRGWGSYVAILRNWDIGDDVRRVFDAMNVPAPPVDREVYTIDEFFDELVDPCRTVRVATTACVTDRS